MKNADNGGRNRGHNGGHAGRGMPPADFLRAVPYIFLLLSVIFLLVSDLFYRHADDFKRHAVCVPGVVTAIEKRNSDDASYYSVVSFTTLEGRKITFTASYGTGSPAFEIGEKIQVLYPPDFPHDALIDNFASLWMSTAITGGFGSIFFLCGAAIHVFNISHLRKILYLREQGVPVYAQIEQIAINENLTVNGQNPYRIIARWQDGASGQSWVFKSTSIWYDPTAHLQGGKIKVMIERGNPKKYWMDITFLPDNDGAV